MCHSILSYVIVSQWSYLKAIVWCQPVIIGVFFRSGIPVIIMGETGCGKTHLIRFMCSLKAGPGGPQNMILVKV